MHPLILPFTVVHLQDCGPGCQSGPCSTNYVPGAVYNFNYCGVSWFAANGQCSIPCPGGTTAEVISHYEHFSSIADRKLSCPQSPLAVKTYLCTTVSRRSDMLRRLYGMSSCPRPICLPHNFSKTHHIPTHTQSHHSAPNSSLHLQHSNTKHC